MSEYKKGPYTLVIENYTVWLESPGYTIQGQINSDRLSEYESGRHKYLISWNYPIPKSLEKWANKKAYDSLPLLFRNYPWTKPAGYTKRRNPEKIFGYDWADIKARQQGTYRPQAPTGGRPGPTASDYALLKKHGLTGLKRMGLHGVIDKLRKPHSRRR